MAFVNRFVNLIIVLSTKEALRLDKMVGRYIQERKRRVLQLDCNYGWSYVIVSWIWSPKYFLNQWIKQPNNAIQIWVSRYVYNSKGEGCLTVPHFGWKLVRGPNGGGAVARGWRAWVMASWVSLVFDLGKTGFDWVPFMCLSFQRVQWSWY